MAKYSIKPHKGYPDFFDVFGHTAGKKHLIEAGMEYETAKRKVVLLKRTDKQKKKEAVTPILACWQVEPDPTDY